MWSTFGWHAAAKWPTTSVLLLVAAKKKWKKLQTQREMKQEESGWRRGMENSRSKHKANFEEFLIKMQGSFYIVVAAVVIL